MLNSSMQLAKWSAMYLRLCGSAIVRVAPALSVKAGRLGQFVAIALLLTIGPRPALSQPSAPTNLAASSGTSQVVLTWTSSGGATGYDIYRSTTSGGEVDINSTGTTPAYTDSSVTNGHTYYYEVEAVNSSGTSSPSSEVKATPIAAPGSPAATGGNTQITFSWSASTGATSYNVYRATTSGGEGSTPVATDIITNGYTDNGLDNGTIYYYDVAAVDATGSSTSSSEVNASPTNSGSCSLPVVTVLHSFGDGSVANDGHNPLAEVIQGADGNFYGTTEEGGSDNKGTVFMMTPSGQITILHSFGDGSVTNDGQIGVGGLVEYDGNFYGVTSEGGANGDGAIFEISPPTPPSTTWTVTILYSFGNVANDGYNPYAGLVQTGGDFYGVTTGGGSNGGGVIFKVTPLGAYSILYNFGTSHGSSPYGALVYNGNDGYLYGTTKYGGSNSDGTVFKSSTSGTESVLYSFGSVTNDGLNPVAGLTLGADGNLYGTTTDGGADSDGTTFMITTSGTETILHSFAGSAVGDDGQTPWGGLIQAMDGNFYGTTEDGGAATLGMLFEMTPYGQIADLYDFEGINAADAASPYATLTLGSNGEFYGTTLGGGTADYGTVFELSFGMCAGSTPAYLTATAGNAEVTLNWTANSGATSYSIYRATTSGGEGATPLQTGITTVSYTDTTVTNGTTYFYTVNAVNAISASPSSNEVGATPSSPSVPSAPTSPSATGGIAQISLAWTASAGASSYNIYRATTSGGEGSTPVFSGIVGTSYIDHTVQPGSTDYYEITAVNTSGESSKSSEVSANETPGASILSMTSSAGAAPVILVWTAGAGASSYNIYRSTTSGGETSLHTGISATSYTDTAASSGGTYYYYVKGYNPAGAGYLSAQSNEVEASPTAPPGAPTLTATAAPTEAILNWTSSSGATSYSVYRATAPQGEGSTALHAGITSTTYTDSSLTNSTTYYYTVAAFDAGGSSPMSNEVAVIPKASGNTYGPTGLTGTPGDGFVVLNWTGSSNGTSYSVYRAASTGGEGNTPLYTGVATPYTDTNVTDESTYFYTVKAVSTSGTSVPSNEAAATPVVTSGQQNTSAPLLDVQSLVDNAIALHLSTVTLPAGTFRVTTATVNLNNITTTTNPNGLTIQGPGSGLTTLLFSDTHYHAFGILLSSNVTLSGFTIDYDPLPFTEGPVSALANATASQVVLSWQATAGATSYDVYRSTSSGGVSGSPIATPSTTSYTDTNVSASTLYYYTFAAGSSVTELEITTPAGSNTSSTATMTIDRTSGGAGYPAWSSDFNVNHPMVFNGTSPYDWETGVADLYLTSPTSTAAGPATGEITLFSQSNQNMASDGLALGDLVALNYRSQQGIGINNSSSTTVQGITVNAAPGLAVVSTFASGENYFSYNVTPGPTPSGATYPRLLSSCADAFNYSDSRVGPVLNGCSFSRMGDDNVNTHGPFFNVSQVNGSTLQVQNQSGDLANYASTTTGYSPLLQATDTARIMAEGNLAVLAKPAISYWQLLPALTASAGASQVTLTWTVSSGATSYNVYRGTTSGGESATAIGSVTVPADYFSATYTDTAVSSGTTYFYTVTAEVSNDPTSNQALATPGGSSSSYSGGFTLSPTSEPSLSLAAAGTGTGSAVDVDTTSSTWTTWGTLTPPYLALDSGPYCLKAEGTSSGSDVQIWSCDGDSDEQWLFTATGGNEKIQLGSSTGPCLDATGTTSGSSVEVKTCTSGGAQVWQQAAPPRAYQVVLTSSVPSSVAFGDHFDDPAVEAPGLLIANSSFGDNRGRGILDRSSNSLIVGNTFDDTTDAGIIVGPAFGTFLEAGWVTGVTVENNTFSTIGTRTGIYSLNSYDPGAITVGALLSSTPPVTDFSQDNSNITISDNTIDGSTVAGIFVNAAQNVTISGNTISADLDSTGACSAGSMNDFLISGPITVVNSTGVSGGDSDDSCPGDVVYLSATAGSSSGEINLAWTPSPGATSYNVYEGTSSGGESASPVMTGVSTTTTTVDSLSTGTTYYFTVAAVNATGTSAMSNEAHAEAP